MRINLSLFLFCPNKLHPLFIFSSKKVECHPCAGFVSMLGEGNSDDGHGTNYFYYMANALTSLYPKYFGIFSISSVRLASYHSTGML